MSQSSNKSVAVAISAAVATCTLFAGSMFSMRAMAHGHMQDAANTAAAEGKCGGGTCGAGKMAAGNSAHEGGGSLAKMDTDNDGRLSRAEFEAAHKGSEEKFASHDGNGDGFISQAEMDAHHAEMKKAAPAAKGKM